MYNYFSRLAIAFSEGRFYIFAENVDHLSELIPINGNQYFVPYAPFPAILLTPFAHITGFLVNQTFFSILAGSLLSVVIFYIAKKITKSNYQSVFVSLSFSLGTNLWFNSALGYSWYFAQVVACLSLSLAIDSRLRGNDKWTGLFLGAAYLSRPHVILSLPFFMFFTRKNKYIKIFYLLLGILPFMFFNFYYNFVRFGVIWDKGYSLIPGVLEEPWYQQGIFHWSYIPRHLDLIFFGLPNYVNKFPYLIPNSAGMALLLTSPVFIILIFSDFKNRVVRLASLSSLLILTPILMHGTTGFSQFGYRFAIDIYPFLILIMTYSLKSRFKKYYWGLLATSIIINFWGVVYA